VGFSHHTLGIDDRRAALPANMGFVGVKITQHELHPVEEVRMFVTLMPEIGLLSGANIVSRIAYKKICFPVWYDMVYVSNRESCTDRTTYPTFQVSIVKRRSLRLPTPAHPSSTAQSHSGNSFHSMNGTEACALGLRSGSSLVWLVREGDLHEH